MEASIAISVAVRRSKDNDLQRNEREGTIGSKTHTYCAKASKLRQHTACQAHNEPCQLIWSAEDVGKFVDRLREPRVDGINASGMKLNDQKDIFVDISTTECASEFDPASNSRPLIDRPK